MGGIGSGKSVVVEYFIFFGVYLVDVDYVVCWVVELGCLVLVKIVECFGDGIFLFDGQFDCVVLCEWIFQVLEEWCWLE